MKYIVVGGAGFIGSHIVDQLLSLNHEVVVLDNFSTGDRNNLSNDAQVVEIDVSKADQRLLNQYINNSAAVFHCAALPNVQFSVEHPHEASIANVDTTIKILEAIRINNIPKIIYSSSSSVYGNAKSIPTTESSIIQPISPYALQKYIGEEYCYLYDRMYGIKSVIFRYFNVYGERMTDKGAYVSVLSHFLRAMKQSMPLRIVNDGNQKRDFIYVKDIARANVMAALSNAADGAIMNLGSGTSYSINTIADWFGQDKEYGETRIEPYETLADISLATRLLGWKPEQDLRSWIQKQI